MLFDQRSELPVATIHGAGSLQRWLAARWTWLRPRMIPVTVALIGMFAVIGAVNYLAHPPAAEISASASQPDAQPAYGFHIKLVLQQ